MRNPWAEIIAGTLVLVVAVGFALVGVQRAGFSGSSASYDIVASFRSAEGISVGTDVRLAGVKVGSVQALELNPQTFRADAIISVANGIEIPDDSSIVIASEGLLGGNFVDVQPGGSPFVLAAGDEVMDTQGAVSLINLLAKFAAGSGSN